MNGSSCIEPEPPKPPAIVEHEDLEFEAGTTGHLINWSIIDANIESYEVFWNGDLLEVGEWDGSNIIIYVDIFEPGEHNVTLLVYDSIGDSDRDTVFVVVTDSVLPVVDSPENIEYEGGTIGHSINWTAFDLYQDSYEIYRNGTRIKFGLWISTNIIVSINGLTPGKYNITIVLFDTSDNSVTDTVYVIVIDTIIPILDSPLDIEYEAGTVGHIITWNADELFPKRFEISINGTLSIDGDWRDDAIAISVDQLDPSMYEYTLTVIDSSGNQANDTVIVTVVDTTPPVINHPGDIVITEGVVGNYINWEVSDLYPASYSIRRNETELVTGIWEGDIILISIDGLSPGVYYYHITIEDESGNGVTDEVKVTVIPSTETTPSTTPTNGPTSIMGFMTIVITIGSVVIIVVFSFLIFRSRNHPN
jgi:hypothetical protein